MTIPGIDPIIASAMVATIGDGSGRPIRSPSTSAAQEHHQDEPRAQLKRQIHRRCCGSRWRKQQKHFILAAEESLYLIDDQLVGSLLLAELFDFPFWGDVKIYASPFEMVPAAN